MAAYLSILSGAECERVIEKSRFLTYAVHVESEEEARAYLALLREKHPLATHICYAFVADRVGNVVRFSDDGEPQGTAGMPILGVLRAKKLFETLVATVRYFGGIKLGAGGLTRAYGGTAKLALDAAGISRMRLWSVLMVPCPYPLYERMRLLVEKCGGVVDLEMDDISSVLEKAAAHFDGHVAGHVTYFYGTCGRCTKSGGMDLSGGTDLPRGTELPEDTALPEESGA